MTEAFSEIVIELMDNRGLTEDQLAHKARLGSASLKRVLDGEGNPSEKEGQRLAKVLKPDDIEMFNIYRAGYTPEYSYSKVVRGEKPGVIGVIQDSKGQYFSRKPA